MDGIVVLLLIIFSIISAINKKKQKAAQPVKPAQTLKNDRALGETSGTAATKLQSAPKPVQRQTIKPAPVAQVKAHQPAVHAPSEEGFQREQERDGSIAMPQIEPHEHEGKPMPCPAEEREVPRPRPSQLAQEESTKTQPALQLAFNQNSILQAVVMSEVLKRPAFKNGRRVLR